MFSLLEIIYMIEFFENKKYISTYSNLQTPCHSVKKKGIQGAYNSYIPPVKEQAEVTVAPQPLPPCPPIIKNISSIESLEKLFTKLSGF